MNNHPAITDDPLPDGETVSGLPDNKVDEKAHAAPSAFGQVDPHSLAGVDSEPLHDPDLHLVAQDEVDAPALSPEAHNNLPDMVVSEATGEGGALLPQVTAAQVVVVPVTKSEAMVAHLAQVGLTSSDQWDEHFQPRIQKLHDDIAQVHLQLDQLARKNPLLKIS